MLGLKRGAVALYPHEKAWETEAQATMARLRQILGPVAVEMAHVGSTAIPTIQAKPILDIAVAVDDFDALLAYEKQLRAAGFYYRPNAQAGVRGQLLFASGSYYDGSGDLQTHFIHIVRTGSVDWQNYILFRDYLPVSGLSAHPPGRSRRVRAPKVGAGGQTAYGQRQRGLCAGQAILYPVCFAPCFIRYAPWQNGRSPY